MIKFHCLFEQSGTFKNVFKSYGHESWDYDILNDYGETDFKIDLFNEIQIAYNKLTQNKEWLIKYYEFDYITIFDKMKPETDFIMAFFPCTYFTDTNEMLFGSNTNTKIPKTNKKSIERVLQRTKDRALFFEIWIKFCFICEQLKIPTIIENPRGMLSRSFLKLYSPWQPQFTDNDRSKFGDKFVKATCYWGINFELKENFIMFDKNYMIKRPTVDFASGKERSEITPRYADNFYKRFLQDRV